LGTARISDGSGNLLPTSLIRFQERTVLNARLQEGGTMPEPVAGCVNIANDVLADLAGYAALESYGIVGMASPSLRDGVAQLLPAQKLRRGVKVTSTDDGILVGLFVIIESGTNLPEVSHNLANRVRYVLTNMADVVVADVDVHVQGVKVRTP
jgi:uncharacterized alkaline shock family protein YloU